MKLETKKIDDLIPYARNARTHSDAQVAQIAASIKEFGWTNPVLVDEENSIIAGHGRVAAARKLGLKEVPVIEISGLSKNQIKALILADNKLALNAGWDLDLLALELQELQLNEYDIKVIGFDAKELDQIFSNSEGDDKEDDIPAAPDEPISKDGDIWLLGSHRLIVGDCTNAQNIERLFNGIKPSLMVTDPPYGVEYDPEWREKHLGKSKRGRAVGVVANDDKADWRDAWALFPGDVVYVWHGSLQSDIVVESLKVCGFELRTQIIWAKQVHAISRGHYHHQHEPCWYAVRKGKTANWTGDRKQTTLWNITNRSAAGGAKEDADTNHSTQKPVECMRRPILNNSNPGQVVYDPFLGSGTTLIAAELTGRICFGCELNPVYADVIVKRWENLTGKKAELEKR